MKHLFVPYELALKLKEKGFDEPCLGCYYKDKTFAYHPDSDVYVDAPLYQQVIDWFREKHKIQIFIYPLGFYYRKMVQQSKEDYQKSSTPAGFNWSISGWETGIINGNLNTYDIYLCYNKAIEEALKLI